MISNKNENKHKPYPKYKPSGIDWIGDIPQHWGKGLLRWLVRLPITDGPHETPDFLDEGIPFISVEGIQDSKINFNYANYISTKDNVRFSLKCKPQKEDILLCKSGSIGKLAIVDTDIEFNIWSPIALIRLNLDKLSPKYIFYLFHSSSIQIMIKIFSSISIQPNINMKRIRDLMCLIPPFTEQRTIADYLDHQTSLIDKAIKKSREIIEKLKEKRTAVINKAVTKGLDPNVKMKPSGIDWIGYIPEHWEVKSL